MPQAIYGRLLVALTVALFAGPILAGLLVQGARHAYAYLAADSFYYFAMARNVNLHGAFTYDLEHPANGFHPLWQLWLVLLYRVGGWSSLPDSAFPVAAVLSSVGFISLAIWLLARCFISTRGVVPVAFVFLPVGVYGVLKAFTYPNYGTLWSYADGMESCLAILAYALLLFLMTRRGFLDSPAAALQTGTAAAFLCLARLDQALFVIPLFGCLGLQSLARLSLRRFLLSVLAGMPVVVAMLAYFAINMHYTGSAIPGSGVVKSTFPDVCLDGARLFVGAIKHPNAPANSGVAWRGLQILVPMVFAVAALLRSLVLLLRKRHSQLDFALAVTAFFVLLLGLYNGLFVGLSCQGHWYFPVSVLFVSVFTIQALCGFVPPVSVPTKRTWIALAGLSIMVAGASSYYWINQHLASYSTFFRDEVEPLREHYKGQSVKLLEYEDGLLCYATGFQAMSGTLLMADEEAVDHVMRQRRSLLTLAYARGFDRTATWGYGGLDSLEYDSLPREMAYEIKRSYLGREVSLLDDPWPFLFEVDYVSPSRRLRVLRIRPVTQWYLKAKRQANEENWAEVVRALDRAAAESDAAPPGTVFGELGEAYLKLGDDAEAAAAFAHSLEENLALLEAHPLVRDSQLNDIGEINLRVARAYVRLGDLEHARPYLARAEEALEKAVAFDPQSASAVASLAQVHELRGDG